MWKPSDSMLANFQNAQSSVMGDLCNIQRVTWVTGTYSDQETMITSGTYSVPCGFYFTNGQITERGQIIVVEYDVEMRLPVSILVNMSDRFELIEKGNVAVSGTFIPYQAPKQGATATVVHLKREV